MTDKEFIDRIYDNIDEDFEEAETEGDAAPSRRAADTVFSIAGHIASVVSSHVPPLLAAASCSDARSELVLQSRENGRRVGYEAKAGSRDVAITTIDDANVLRVFSVRTASMDYGYDLRRWAKWVMGNE